MNFQRLFLDNLDLINQIVRSNSRRRHLSAAEREDFASAVHLRFVEGDYAVLRKFRGSSSLHTYLIAVIERQCHDFCSARWGRWRPSAMARRLGPAAIILERLVTRDSHSVDEAMEIVRTHHEVTLSHAELRRIWEQLPARARVVEVNEDAAADLTGNEASDTALEDQERQQEIDRLQEVLRNAFNTIAAKDRVVIALRYDQDLSIAQIATLMGSSVATLHRRLEKSLKQLFSALSEAGFDKRSVVDLIGHPAIAMSPLLRAEVERFLRRVRLSDRDE